VGENSRQWVDIWGQADIKLTDGKVQKMVLMDTFTFGK
jgi:hypothetical protein